MPNPIETILLDGGVVEECPDSEDLCLTQRFAQEWERQIDAIEELDVPTLASAIGVAEDRISMDDKLVYLRSDSMRRQWAYRAGAIADVAAADLLRSRVEDWEEWGPEERKELLSRLRIFLKRCPRCDGDVLLERESITIGSRTPADQYTLTCTGCDALITRLDTSPVNRMGSGSHGNRRRDDLL